MENTLPKLTHEELIKAQQETLASPRRSYGGAASLLFHFMDLVYGKRRSIKKFKVLEVVARVPYQTWEHVAYIAITHKYTDTTFARRVFERIKESRDQQDNEQWHLLILEEMLDQEKVRQGFVRYQVIPQILAFVYYQLSWVLYVVRPAASYSLNADFEDHAEHEYMLYVNEHPELESKPWESEFIEDYGDHDSRADLFRQIGHDERVHKQESLDAMEKPRFQ